MERFFAYDLIFIDDRLRLNQFGVLKNEFFQVLNENILIIVFILNS